MSLRINKTMYITLYYITLHYFRRTPTVCKNVDVRGKDCLMSASIQVWTHVKFTALCPTENVEVLKPTHV